MESFNVKKFNDKEIVLNSCEDMHKLYKVLHDDETVQFVWFEEIMKKSEMIISSNIVGKIRSGEIIIRSEEKKE